MGTPTVLFFSGGREVERVVGFVGSRYLREVVETELLGTSELASRRSKHGRRPSLMS